MKPRAGPMSPSPTKATTEASPPAEVTRAWASTAPGTEPQTRYLRPSRSMERPARSTNETPRIRQPRIPQALRGSEPGVEANLLRLRAQQHNAGNLCNRHHPRKGVHYEIPHSPCVRNRRDSVVCSCIQCGGADRMQGRLYNFAAKLHRLRRRHHD